MLPVLVPGYRTRPKGVSRSRPIQSLARRIQSHRPGRAETGSHNCNDAAAALRQSTPCAARILGNTWVGRASNRRAVAPCHDSSAVWAHVLRRRLTVLRHLLSDHPDAQSATAPRAPAGPGRSPAASCSRFGQQFLLFAGLRAFRHHLHFQRAAQRDDLGNDGSFVAHVRSIPCGKARVSAKDRRDASLSISLDRQRRSPAFAGLRLFQAALLDQLKICEIRPVASWTM